MAISTKVSWLIPVKNGMPYLTEMLASLEKQTFRDFEVLAWDDGSTDDTLEELRRWIPDRLPGRIITGQPKGLAGALAGLVEISQAKYCARIDADDVALPERLARQIEFLESHPEVALVGGQMRYMDDAGRDLGLTTKNPLDHVDIIAELLVKNPIAHPCVVFRRQAIVAAGNYCASSKIEDYELWLRLAKTHRLANQPQTLLHYRSHASSYTQQAIRRNELSDRMKGALVEHAPSLFGWDRETAARFHDRQIRFMLGPCRQLGRHLAAHFDQSVWKTLRNPYLIDALFQQTKSWDIISLLALCWLDPRPFTLTRRLKNFVKNRAKSIPTLQKFVRACRQWRKERRIAHWINTHNGKGCALDKQLWFTGKQNGEDHVHLSGENYIERDVTIWISNQSGSDPLLSLGVRAFVGQNAYLGVHYPVQIGKNVMIGAYSYIISANHRFARRDIPIQDQGFEGAPITIEDEAWLGTHVVILPGVRIGRGAIIGAGSVVTKDVPAWEIWGGVPARFIKMRPE